MDLISHGNEIKGLRQTKKVRSNRCRLNIIDFILRTISIQYSTNYTEIENLEGNETVQNKP